MACQFLGLCNRVNIEQSIYYQELIVQKQTLKFVVNGFLAKLDFALYGAGYLLSRTKVGARPEAVEKPLADGVESHVVQPCTLPRKLWGCTSMFISR